MVNKTVGGNVNRSDTISHSSVELNSSSFIEILDKLKNRLKIEITNNSKNDVLIWFGPHDEAIEEDAQILPKKCTYYTLPSNIYFGKISAKSKRNTSTITITEL